VKKTTIFLALLPFLISSRAYICQKEIKVEDVKAEIALHLDKPEQGFVKIIPKIESDTPLSRLGNDFFEDNFLYVDYLTKHDENYTESITQVFGTYLLAKGQKISGLVEKLKERFSLCDLKATAIRFIFPSKVTKKGKIGTRICVTGEGFLDYSERNINLEAFTFYAIFNEIKKEEASFLMPRIQEYSKLAVSLKLSTNERDLLKRAQGLMWALFYNDKDFEKMLIDCYQKKAEYLPFEIVFE